MIFVASFVGKARDKARDKGPLRGVLRDKWPDNRFPLLFSVDDGDTATRDPLSSHPIVSRSRSLIRPDAKPGRPPGGETPTIRPGSAAFPEGQRQFCPALR